MPSARIWPQALPPAGQERLQITTELVVPLTVALNTIVPPGWTWGKVGEMETDTAAATAVSKAKRRRKKNLKTRVIWAPVNKSPVPGKYPLSRWRRGISRAARCFHPSGWLLQHANMAIAMLRLD